MPNPKRRHSKSRTRRGRAHDARKTSQFYINKDTGEAKKSHRVDYTDRGTCVIFGDDVGAVASRLGGSDKEIEKIFPVKNCKSNQFFVFKRINKAGKKFLR